MLSKEDIINSLQDLGITGENYRLLSLLPLVLVAWADGRVQRAEKKRIVEIAESEGFLHKSNEAMVENWLTQQPSRDYYDKGFKVLVELGRRQRGEGSDITTQTLSDLVDLSVDIAQAAGGLFGRSRSISVHERTALHTLAQALTIDDGQSWTELLEDLED